MIRMMSLLESNRKIFKYTDSKGKVWKALLSPSISNSIDNPNDWKFRITLFSTEKNVLIPYHHVYLDSDSEDTILSTLKHNFNWLGPWEKI